MVWRVVTEVRTGEAGGHVEDEGLAIGRVTGPVTEEAGAVMQEGDSHFEVQSRFLAKA